MSAFMSKTLVALAGLLLVGCHVSDAVSERAYLAPGTYQLAFSTPVDTVASGAGPAFVTGIDLTVTLPKNATVATAQGGTGPILASALTTGSGLKGTTLLIGQFSAEQHEAHLSLTAAPSAAWKGEFARLSFTLQPGILVSEEVLLALVRGAKPRYQVVGLTSAGHETVTLTDSVATTVALIKP